jgi:probable rRNA maturation factor
MNTESPNLEDPDSVGAIVVELSDTQSHLRIDRGALTRVASATLLAEGVNSASVSIAVVDNATIRTINRDYLGHDWPTDVISFGFSHPGDPLLTGELVISGQMAAATAREAGVDDWNELALYVVHGLLHLCGHDDSDPASRVQMRQRERAVLAGLGLANPLDALAGAGEDEPDDVVGRRSEAALWTS